MSGPYRSPRPTVVAATAGRDVFGQNDDRAVVDRDRGLFAVVDASGPTYGGYYAPFGVAPAIEALRSSFTGDGELEVRLERAVRAMHGSLRDGARVLDALVERAKRGTAGPSVAGFAGAVEAVRPPHWEHLRGQSLAHYAASITACSVDDQRGAVLQLGSCRAYRRRGADLELLLVDDTLASRQPDSSMHPVHARTIVLRALGLRDELEPAVRTFDAAPGDRIALVGNGLWAHDDGDARVRGVFGACESDAALRTYLERLASDGRTTCTAVVLSL